MRSCQEEIISWDQKPRNYQLPFFCLLSHKSFTNFVSVLTDENFLHNRVLLLSISFDWCLPTMQFIQSSVALSSESFRNGKHLKCNCTLPKKKTWLLMSLSSWYGWDFSTWTKVFSCWFFSVIAPFHPCLSMFNSMQFMGSSNRVHVFARLPYSPPTPTPPSSFIFYWPPLFVLFSCTMFNLILLPGHTKRTGNVSGRSGNKLKCKFLFHITCCPPI